MTRTLAEVKVWYDTQDPDDPGWSYRAYYDDDQQESGPLDASEWQEAVNEASGLCGLDAPVWASTTDGAFIWES